MKHIKNTLAILVLVMIGLGISQTVRAEDCPDDGSLSMCCLVTNPNNPSYDDSGAYYESLHTYLKLFNSEDSGTRFCRERIAFDTGTASVVKLKRQVELKVEDTIANFTLGNESNTTTLKVYDLQSGSNGDNPPLIVVGTDSEAVQNVTIKNLKIETASGEDEGTHGALVKCVSGSHNLTIEDVTINNKPVEPIQIEGCNNVEIFNLQVNGQGDTGEPVIYVKDSRNFTLVNGSGYDFDSLIGGGLVIENSDGYTVDSLLLNYSSSASSSATGITVIESYGDLAGVEINDIKGTGVELVDLSDGGYSDFSLVLNAKSGNSADGLVLTNVYGAVFDDLAITNFGGNGVVIEGDSDNNSFSGSGVAIYSNAGHGILVQDTSYGSPGLNTISGAEIINNTQCGIYLDSGTYNYISQNNLYNNDACGVGASSSGVVDTLDDDDVIILAQGQTGILVDITTTRVNGFALDKLELHQILSDYSSYEGESYYLSRTTAGSVAKSVASVVGPIDFDRMDVGHGTSYARTARSARTGAVKSAQTSLVSRGRVGAGASAKYKTAMTVSNSWIGQYDVGDEADDLPASEPGINPGALFFAMVYDTQGLVVGVWHGTASDDAGNFTNGCYLDSKGNTYYRVYDADSDLDGDGLMDWQEDANLNCQQDSGETKVGDDDTDNDSIDDGTEQCINGEDDCNATDPLDDDSDDDGLKDGEEDTDFDGVFEPTQGESNPNDADTDDDGSDDKIESKYGTDPNDKDTDDDSITDGEDKCPLVNANEQSCYYDYCIPADEYLSSSISVGGDDESGESCEDADDDGICNSDEDKDSDCRRDDDETDANSADSDGDGIEDGVEDFDQDGEYESDQGETNPLSTDSDSDCVADGAEDKNADGKVDLVGGETDPTAVDSDGDGIEDGEEDYNCDGDNDDGETKPWLADTDGDGTGDATDLCPWNIDSSCVVRYCGINGFETYDADGDGLPDADEDFNGNCAWNEDNREPNPLDDDTDDDGLNDAMEVECFETNPNASDTDGDGRSDYDEVENSLDQCQPMYNLGDTDPKRAEYGGCGLVANRQATRSGFLPITILAALCALVLVALRRNKKGHVYGKR